VVTEPASERVVAFFESYRAAFERLDADAIADYFAYPSHMTSDAGEIELTPILARGEWRGQIEQLVGMYRAIGVSSARILRLTSTDLSPRVVQAMVHWALRDGLGADLYDFHALYTLVEIDGALQIGAIAHDEIPRSQEFMALRRSDTSR
jgi:hypothetical protein